jgi:hypothetical protein
MEQAWLREGEHIITESQFNLFNTLIKFAGENPKLYNEWLEERKK